MVLFHIMGQIFVAKKRHLVLKKGILLLYHLLQIQAIALQV